MMNDFIVVILNWNKSFLTINFVNNLLSIEGKDLNIIIVDNNSSNHERNNLINFARQNNWIIIDEDKLEQFKNNKAFRFLILLKNNYGYARGNNFGLKFARKLGYKYAIISNNDIIIEIPIIFKLKEIFSSYSKIAVVGPKVLDLNNRLQGPYRKPDLWDYFIIPLFYPFFYPLLKLRDFLRKNLYKNIIFPYRIIGCFMMVDLEIMEKIGYFDENTFLYAEELILAEKLYKYGYKIAYIPKVYIKHIHEETTKNLGDKFKYFLQLKSELYYFKNYRGYDKMMLFLIFFSKCVFFYIWKPILEYIRKLISQNY